MAELHVAGARAFCDQSPAVEGAMVRSAEHDQLVRIVAAAFRSRLQVMHVEEARVATAGDGAASPIAM